MADQIRPGGGDHAIEVMAFGVEWTQPLPAEILQRLSEVYSGSPALQEFLPGRRTMPGLGLQIAVKDGAADVAATQRQEVVDFVRLGPAGSVEWSISIRPDFISCNCSAYAGWRSTKPRALSLLRLFLECAVEGGSKIGVVGLQYFDVFRWPVNRPDLLDKVIRRDSKWLPAHAFGGDSLWHVHQGWFSPDSSSGRVLNNLNVDLQEDEADFVLRIDGQHRRQSVKFGRPPTICEITLSEVGLLLDDLHEINKRVLGTLLTETVLGMIKMKVPNNG